jgi:hypothetical protein
MDIGVSYGDTISVFTQSVEMDGHLRADGFADDDVTVALSEEGKLPSNFEECLFQIVPRLHYLKVATKYEALKSPPTNSNASPPADPNRPSLKFPNPLHASPSTDYDEISDDLLLDKEYALNEDTERQQLGMPLKFGSHIQLRHVKSGKFLTVMPRQVAFRERDAMQVKLDSGSNDSAFDVRAMFKLRKDGGVVHWNDECVLSNTGYGLSLHCSKHRATPRRADGLSDVDTSTKQHECNASPRSTGWQFKLYSSFAISASALPKSLRSGDVVRLQHTESQGYICCEEFSLDTVHIRVAVETPHSQKEEHHVGQLWKVEMGTQDSGGLARFKRTVRFKHVSSGRYLCVNHTAMTASEQRKNLSSLKKHGNPKVFFQLEGTSQENSENSVSGVSTQQSDSWEDMKHYIAAGSIHKLTSRPDATDLANFQLERTSPGPTSRAGDRDSDVVNVTDFVYLKSAHGWVHTPKETELEESARKAEWRNLVGEKYFSDISPTKLGVVSLQDNATHEGAFGFVLVSRQNVHRCEQLKPVLSKLSDALDRLVAMGPWEQFSREELSKGNVDEAISEFDASSGIMSPRWGSAITSAVPILQDVKEALHRLSQSLGELATRTWPYICLNMRHAPSRFRERAKSRSEMDTKTGSRIDGN